MDIGNALRGIADSLTWKLHDEQSGMMLPPTPSFKHWIDDPEFYRKVEFVYRAVAAIGESGALVPFKVNEMQEGAPEVVAEGEAANALRRLLDHPNADMSGSYLRELTHIDLELWGNAFWLIEVDKVTGIPTRLFPLRPSLVSVNGSQERGRLVKSYNFQLNDGKAIQIAPEFIVHFKMPSPFDDLWGLAPLTAARKESTRQRFITVNSLPMPPSRGLHLSLKDR